MEAPGGFRLLAPGDDELLERFLSRRRDSSMFLRSNARAFGLRDEGAGERLQGSYVAAFDPAGEVMGAAAHYRNGMLVLQAPEPGMAGALARCAVDESRRPIEGLIGPLAQVVEARAALGFADRRAALESEEILLALDLDGLQLPPAIADGRLACRAPVGDDEVAQVCAWRASYCVEALGSQPGPELEHDARISIESEIADGRIWLLVEREGGGRARMFAMTATNARLPDMVNIGGVYTPPALRRRGLARAVVAGQLLDERRAGAHRAVLFTGHDNIGARRAYEALGFRAVGDYALVLFAS